MSEGDSSNTLQDAHILLLHVYHESASVERSYAKEVDVLRPIELLWRLRCMWNMSRLPGGRRRGHKRLDVIRE